MGAENKEMVKKWDQAKVKFPEIKGSEKIIKENWDKLEASSLLFIYTLIK